MFGFVGLISHVACLVFRTLCGKRSDVHVVTCPTARSPLLDSWLEKGDPPENADPLLQRHRSAVSSVCRRGGVGVLSERPKRLGGRPDRGRTHTHRVSLVKLMCVVWFGNDFGADCCISLIWFGNDFDAACCVSNCFARILAPMILMQLVWVSHVIFFYCFLLYRRCF